MEPEPAPDDLPRDDGAGALDPVEFRLIVSASPASGWRACVIGPGEVRRDFISPFALARFIAWPHAARPGSSRDRLR